MTRAVAGWSRAAPLPRIERGAGRRLAAWLAPVVRRIHGSFGCILLFHRVAPRERRPRLANADVEVTVDFLRAVVALLRKWEFTLCSIDEFIGSLKRGERGRPRAVLTFDDGYADYASAVAPMLRRLEVPSTVYVVSDHVTRRSTYWWYLLEEHLLRSESVTVNGRVLPARTRTEKMSAYETAAKVLERLGASDSATVQRRMFGRSLMRRTATSLAMDRRALRNVASDPLVTVGAHTRSHPILALLDRTDVERELRDGRRQIESILATRIDHLAFPYGGAAHVGAREVALAREMGFKSATTTRLGHVYEEHREHLHSLPRIYVRRPSMSSMRVMLSGVGPLLRNRGRRVVVS